MTLFALFSIVTIGGAVVLRHLRSRYAE